MSSSSNRQGTLDQWLGGGNWAPRRGAAKAEAAPAPEMASQEEFTQEEEPMEWEPSQEDASQEPSSGSRAHNDDNSNSNYRRGTALAAIAKETRIVLPDILKHLPHLHASRSEAHHNHSTPRLRPEDCPRRTPSGRTRIRVVNDDTLNAATNLASSVGPRRSRVAVLNMANAVVPGGGWLKGARAQEEALCYRSSLSLSLHRRHYPWQQRMGLYSPDVVVIRADQASGHGLLTPVSRPADLPVVSVLSVAAIRCPPVDRVRVQAADGGLQEKHVYARPSDRELTKSKMRLCLRMAAHHGHGLLVLGALGCGAFANPPREVASCWLEVLREGEFAGGWWDEELWFAVFDGRGEGNLEVFEEILDGVEV